MLLDKIYLTKCDDGYVETNYMYITFDDVLKDFPCGNRELKYENV